VPKPGVSKEVVYFLGHAGSGQLRRQAAEISEIRWMDIDEAYRKVTFKNDRNLIQRVRDYLAARQA
jgi:NADH pyrophosphatase NudC (nudix superfamily)